MRQGTPTFGARSWPILGLPFLQFLWAPASGIDEEPVEGSPSNGVELVARGMVRGELPEATKKVVRKAVKKVVKKAVKKTVAKKK